MAVGGVVFERKASDGGVYQCLEVSQVIACKGNKCCWLGDL